MCGPRQGHSLRSLESEVLPLLMETSLSTSGRWSKVSVTDPTTPLRDPPPSPDSRSTVRSSARFRGNDTPRTAHDGVREPGRPDRTHKRTETFDPPSQCIRLLVYIRQEPRGSSSGRCTRRADPQVQYRNVHSASY